MRVKIAAEVRGPVEVGLFRENPVAVVLPQIPASGADCWKDWFMVEKYRAYVL